MIRFVRVTVLIAATLGAPAIALAGTIIGNG